ncbi:MAG: SusC/RagA family TonB-linked outer membrane protein [Bacteroidales bacterium]
MEYKFLRRLLGCIIFFSLSTALVLAQSKSVKGRVFDDLKLEMPGVSVLVKGTTNGTITDIDGNFSINVPDAKSVLQFSFMGYTTQEVVVGSQENLVVVLKEDSKQLDEVVVVGYGEVRRKDLTGAVSQLKPSESESQLFTSVDNLIQGKIAGVNISSSGSTPGGAVSVQIRGANSLRGDNQPLYIIDNIPMPSTAEGAGNSLGDFQAAQNPLTSLNPQDIESVEVLKDASATAIYGARGANGVILITTKKGKKGKTVVNANATWSIANATRLPELLNVEEYALYRNEQNAGTTPQYYFSGSEVRFVTSGAAYNPEDADSYHVVNNEDWMKQVFRQAFSHNYNVSINGGGERTTYYFSAGFKDIEGLVNNTGLTQGDMRLNLNSQLNDRLRLNVIVNGSIKQNDMMSGGDTKGGASGSILRSAIDAAPHQRIIDANTLPEDMSTALSWIQDYDDITINQVFRASATLNWKINNIFSYELRTGGNIRMEQRDRWFGLQLFRGMNDNGVLSMSTISSNNYSVENLLNFRHRFGRILNLSGVVAANYEDYNFVNKLVTGKDFENHSLRTKGISFANSVTHPLPIQRDNQLGSYLGRTNFSFLDGRYLLTASFRADGSSKFAKGNQWGYYPSLSTAWRIEEESFMSGVDFLDQLKLRAGWGITGNQGIDPYGTLSGYARVLDYSTPSGDRLIALGASSIANENLKWETTEAYNVGLDFAFFKQRLSGSFDAYLKTTRDLLIDMPLPPSTGFSTYTINQGSIQNKGLELTLSGQIIQKKDMNLTINGNIGVNRSVVKSLGLQQSKFGNHTLEAYLGRSIGDYFNAVNIFAVGHVPGAFWGYKTDGIIQNSEEVAGMTYKKGEATPGNVKFVDMNGDNIIDEQDMTFIGDPTPAFNYGFQIAFNYKALSVSASFNGVYGNEIFNSNAYYDQTARRSHNNIRKDVFENAWRGEGTSNKYTSVTSAAPNVSMDRFVEDGSFLRCADLTVGYTLPSKWTKQVMLERANLFVSAKNLFLITNYTGFDPEVSSFPNDGLRIGIDSNSFPNPREFVFGVNLTF